MALFGCAPNRPLDYFGSAGLLWAINGGRLAELHRDWAVIDVPLHRSQRIFNRRNVDAAKITLPWARQTRSAFPWFESYQAASASLYDHVWMTG